MFKQRPARLLFHGEFGPHTGFAGVTEALCDRLANLKTEWGTPMFEVGVMALGLGVDPLNGPPKGKPYRIFPMYGDRGRAPFGQDYAQDLVRKFRPDVVITFGDIWMCEWWNNRDIIPEDLRRTFKLLGYIAIDGYPVPHFWIDHMKKFDKVITFTKFGQDTIEERAKEMGVKLNTSHILHGVNPLVFKPLPQNQVEECKRQKGIGPEKKIVGMFSRNQPRKHHPEFIESAVELLKATKNDPNIVLYFHTVERDAGWDLPALINDIDKLKLRDRFLVDGFVGPGQNVPESTYTLEKRFWFPGIKDPSQGYPVDLLNMMYNICDVHLLCTSGEGFGCTLAESLSAGVPTFTNDYAAGAELVRASAGGETIRARDYTYRGSDHNFFRPHTDYEDAVAKILPVLESPDLRKKYSKNGRAWALGMSWDIVIYEWETALKSLFETDVETPVKTEAL